MRGVQLELTEFVTIVITVPEAHADEVRVTMGKAGAGKIGDYSHCRGKALKYTAYEAP